MESQNVNAVLQCPGYMINARYLESAGISAII